MKNKNVIETGVSFAKYLPGKQSIKKTIPLKYKQILSSDVVEITMNCTLIQRKWLRFQAQLWIRLCFNTPATHKSSKGGLGIFWPWTWCSPRPCRWWLYLNGSSWIPDPTGCSPEGRGPRTGMELDADTSPACLSTNGWGKTALLPQVFIKKCEEVINAKTSLSETWVVLGVYQSHFSNWTELFTLWLKKSHPSITSSGLFLLIYSPSSKITLNLMTEMILLCTCPSLKISKHKFNLQRQGNPPWK